MNIEQIVNISCKRICFPALLAQKICGQTIKLTKEGKKVIKAVEQLPKVRKIKQSWTS